MLSEEWQRDNVIVQRMYLRMLEINGKADFVALVLVMVSPAASSAALLR